MALNGNTKLEDFVAFRERRDPQLAAPRLLFRSVQVNVDVGHLPRREGELSYLKMPWDFFKPKGSGGI